MTEGGRHSFGTSRVRRDTQSGGSADGKWPRVSLAEAGITTGLVAGYDEVLG